VASSSADSERVCSAESVLSSAEIGRATVARGASPSEAAPLYAGWPSSLMSMPRSSKSAEMRRWPCALRTRKTRLPRSAAQAIMQPAARKDARRSSPVNEEQVGGEEDEV